MPYRAHSTVIGSSPRSHSPMNAIFSSNTQVSFHGIGKVALCRVENLSGIHPVYHVRHLSGSDR
jgi:hypothetical protein